MRRDSIALFVTMLAALACSKPSDETATTASPAASAAPAGSTAGQAPGAAHRPGDGASGANDNAASKPAGRDVPSVGFVPSWAPDDASQVSCEPADPTGIAAVRKGREDIAAGTANVDEVIGELAGSCNKARGLLATALNDAGFARYSKHEYVKANRFWGAALKAHPSHVLARYNLACGLALLGKTDDALWAIEEVARAARAGDAQAAKQLTKAKTDADLTALRGAPRFDAVVGAQGAGLEGPRSDPQLSARAVKLLPKEFHEDRWPSGDLVKYSPALVKVWTWRPDANTELLVTTLIDDPKKLGEVVEDINMRYGGIAVFRQSESRLELLAARKTGDVPPDVAAARDGSVVYSNDDAACGLLRGSLSWRNGRLAVDHKMCIDRSSKEAKQPPASGTPGGVGETPSKACDLRKFDWKNYTYPEFSQLVKLTNGKWQDPEGDPRSGPAVFLHKSVFGTLGNSGKELAFVVLSTGAKGFHGWSLHVFESSPACQIERVDIARFEYGTFERLELVGPKIVVEYEENGSLVHQEFQLRNKTLVSIKKSETPHPVPGSPAASPPDPAGQPKTAEPKAEPKEAERAKREKPSSKTVRSKAKDKKKGN